MIKNYICITKYHKYSSIFTIDLKSVYYYEYHDYRAATRQGRPGRPLPQPKKSDPFETEQRGMRSHEQNKWKLRISVFIFISVYSILYLRLFHSLSMSIPFFISLYSILHLRLFHSSSPFILFFISVHFILYLRLFHFSCMFLSNVF